MRSLRHFVLVLLILVPLGCADSSHEPLRVASSEWPGYEPLFLAQDLRYLPQAVVRLNELPSSNITMEAFRNQSVDIATLTLDEALTLLAEGRRFRILFVMDVSNGADAVVARPEITSTSGLKGRRVAIANIPLGAYMLVRVLETAGLKLADVTVVPIPEDTHEKTYRENKIDAAITFEPFKSAIVNAGSHVIFDSSNIPNEIFDLLLVDESVYQSRRDELCELARQWYRALDYIHKYPDDAAERMGKRLGVEGKVFLKMMEGLAIPTRAENERLLGGAEPAILGPARRLTDIMRRENMLNQAVDLSAAIDPSFQQCS